MQTNIQDLMVIGYNDRLYDDLLPTLVAPVFCHAIRPDEVLFPGFKLVDDKVQGGHWDSISQWKYLVSHEQMTAIEPVQAQAEYELWVDLNFVVHYEPRKDFKVKAGKISEEYFQLALAAFKNGKSYEVVKKLAGKSYNANCSYKALSLEVAVCRLNNKESESDFLYEMIESRNRKKADKLINSLLSQ